MSEFLRPAEVAPLLGITTGRLYQLIAAGVVPAVKVGGAIRIPTRAWREWLERQSAKALEGLRST